MGRLISAAQLIYGTKTFANDVVIKGKLRLEREITRTALASFKTDRAPGTDLGTLKHHPCNGTNRNLMNGTGVTTGSWSSAVSAAAFIGFGARAVRCKGALYATSSAGGAVNAQIAFGDNVDVTPSFLTSHPQMQTVFTADAAGEAVLHIVELDIPLTAAGFFYWYGITETNCAALMYLTVVAYYL